MLEHARYEHGLDILLSQLDNGVEDVDTLVRHQVPVVGQVVVLEGKLPHTRGQPTVVQLKGENKIKVCGGRDDSGWR